MLWLPVIPSAICYFLFNWQFFRCTESILKSQPMHKRNVFFTFIINYSIFVLCSMLNLHLIINWIIFLILFLAEQSIIYRISIQKSALFALLGTQLGLSVNILCRSLFAVILDMPLNYFDNTISDPGNMKRYPVLLCFLIGGFLFWFIAHFDLLKRMHLVMDDRKTLVFLLGLLVAMYFYLCMNLLVYYIEENNLILKLWSMKSSVFVIMGECLSVFLSIKLGQISDYRSKSQHLQEQMIQEQQRELELLGIASTDPLTGCENRLQAKSRVQEALDAERVFCLGFVDLNELKPVNDHYGHEMGDKYIQAVSGELSQVCRQGDSLFRYGGDEFILLLFDTTVLEVTRNLEQVQKHLSDPSKYSDYPFLMNISYGIASREDGFSVQDLIQIADTRMYQMKKSMHP